MMSIQEKKKRRLNLFKYFRSSKKTTSDQTQVFDSNDADATNGIEPVDYQPVSARSTISSPSHDNTNNIVIPSAPQRKPELNPEPSDYTVENPIENRLYPQLDRGEIRRAESEVNNTIEFCEVDDNMRNEHIEEIRLRSFTPVETDQPVPESRRINTRQMEQGPSVIPEDLDPSLLWFYSHVLLVGMVFAYSSALAIMYTVALVVYSPTAAATLKSIGFQLLKSFDAIGVSVHAVIWILLASFGNIYLAIAYAVLVFCYKMVVSVMQEVATAIAEVLASMIMALFLGPIFALFGAIFSFRGVQPIPSVPGAKAGNIIEAMLKFFLFPIYLPMMLHQFHTRRTAPPPATAAPVRPGRGCEILRRLFGSSRPSTAPSSSSSSTFTSRSSLPSAPKLPSFMNAPPRAPSFRPPRPSRSCDICKRIFR